MKQRTMMSELYHPHEWCFSYWLLYVIFYKDILKCFHSKSISSVGMSHVQRSSVWTLDDFSLYQWIQVNKRWISFKHFFRLPTCVCLGGVRLPAFQANQMGWHYTVWNAIQLLETICFARLGCEICEILTMEFKEAFKKWLRCLTLLAGWKHL